MVTDTGLKELAGLKNLQTLVFKNASVTDTGLKELIRTRRPKIHEARRIPAYMMNGRTTPVLLFLSGEAIPSLNALT